MASLMLVANPAASQFTGGDHRSIVSLLARHHTVEAVWPRSAADARVVAADAVTAGFDGVLAMGGDGIVHQVAQALVGTEVFLSVIPAGTTNVFARQLGLPSKPVKAARVLDGNPQVVRQPVLTIEATRPDGTATEHHAVFALGVGMDADIVAAAETEPYRKYRFGAIHYLRTSVEMLWSDVRHREPTIHADAGMDASVLGVAVLCQFRSAFTYFGNRPLRFVRAEPDPVSVLIVGRIPMRRLPRLLARLATGGSLADVPGIDVWEHVKTLGLTAAPPARFELDGEVIGDLTSATITYRPDAIWVAGPRR